MQSGQEHIIAEAVKHILYGLSPQVLNGGCLCYLKFKYWILQKWLIAYKI
jgi:hypothetical protein